MLMPLLTAGLLSRHPGPAWLPGRVLQAGGSLPLVGRVSLVRFVELSQELDIRHERVDLLQYVIFHSQICIVIPNLMKQFSIFIIPPSVEIPE